jgi:hypothetical protein
MIERSRRVTVVALAVLVLTVPSEATAQQVYS